MDQHVVIGRRIVVGGVSGSGKTTLARAIARRLDIPYICNDAIIHRPNWQPTPPEEKLRAFDQATRGSAWVVDGNFISLKDPEDHLVIGRADTLVWLDLPRAVAFWQVFQRTVRRAATREPLWHGNRESWRMSFASRDSILLWALTTYDLRRRQYQAFFDAPANPVNPALLQIRLRSRREVRAWLNDVAQAQRRVCSKPAASGVKTEI